MKCRPTKDDERDSQSKDRPRQDAAKIKAANEPALFQNKRDKEDGNKN